MVERLSDLREPPVVGRFYLVPVIRGYIWHGVMGDWPVIGPKHKDREFFNFAEEHYHLDARFLTKRQIDLAADRCPWSFEGRSEEGDAITTISGSPLSYRGLLLPKGRPGLARRRCRASSYRNVLGDLHTNFAQFQGAYGSPALAIHLADGRKLCPHRKVDLSQFPADDDGIVTCPLHGLRVCTRAPETVHG